MYLLLFQNLGHGQWLIPISTATHALQPAQEDFFDYAWKKNRQNVKIIYIFLEGSADWTCWG